MQVGLLCARPIETPGVVIRKPFDVLHTSDELNTLVTYLKSLVGETRAVIECTGRYYEPVVKSLSEAGILSLPSIQN